MALKKIESKKESVKNTDSEKKVSAYAGIEAEAQNTLDILANGAKTIRGFRILGDFLIIPTEELKARASLNALEANNIDELISMSESDRLTYGIKSIWQIDSTGLRLFDKSQEAYKGQDFCLAPNGLGGFDFYCLNGSSFKKIEMSLIRAL